MISCLLAWLLTIVRLRIADQVCRRVREQRQVVPRSNNDTIDRIPDPNGQQLEATWNLEWERYRTALALQRLQGKVSSNHLQIFQSW